MRTLSEANYGEKILKDPRLTKMLALAVKHDHTFPLAPLAKLGPNPKDEDVVKLWSQLLDKTLANTNYGDLSREGKFDAWLTRLYATHVNDYEEINGEGGDALGSWKSLQTHRLLQPRDQDFNRFNSLKELQNTIRNPVYREALRKIADQEKTEAMKRDARQIVLIDDDKYYITVPLNYGSCYVFSHGMGVSASYCTGSSSGLSWFTRYSKDGPMIDVLSKDNMEDKNGKWQFHSATNQLKNAIQEYRNSYDGTTDDSEFAKYFPGVLKKIIHALETHAEQLKNSSKDISQDGWNIPEEIDRLKARYPLSYNSSAGKDSDKEASEEDINHLFGRDRG